jgi:hypothetical protein
LVAVGWITVNTTTETSNHPPLWFIPWLRVRHAVGRMFAVPVRFTRADGGRRVVEKASRCSGVFVSRLGG